MIADIRELIAARLLVPFTIYFEDGGAVRAPTVDHVHVTPTGNRTFVSYDNGDYDAIRPLIISRVTVDGQTAAPAS